MCTCHLSIFYCGLSALGGVVVVFFRNQVRFLDQANGRNTSEPCEEWVGVDDLSKGVCTDIGVRAQSKNQVPHLLIKDG